MSLLGTLAKVAVGVAVAKGISNISKGGGLTGAKPQSTSTGAGAGSGTIFGGDRSASTTQSGGPDVLGGLGEMLSGRGTQGGGLGGLLESLSQASRPDGDDGSASAQAPNPAGGSLGDLLNESLEKFGEPEAQPTQSQEEAAKLMLRATLQAAKSDGKIDDGEKEKIFGQLGDIEPGEMTFINEELAKPVDIDGLARDVPRGMGQQVYLMSLMGINLDSRSEAEYLHKLATALSITPNQANAIHARVGVQPIYS